MAVYNTCDLIRAKAMRQLYSRACRKALLISMLLISIGLMLMAVLHPNLHQIKVNYANPLASVVAGEPRLEPEEGARRLVFGNNKPPSGYRPADQRQADVFQEAESTKSKNPKSVYNNALHDENCNPWRDDRVNIHLIPHSHDDVGWLKTADQYYWGDKNNIQNAGVQYIIDGVLSEVARQPDRRFVIVEMAFLWRWWRRQNEASRNLLRRLLERGQVELICAGWSMADEAAVDYVSLIDQHTTGFEFIASEIDPYYRPLIGWQIDPFGHSREVASLFAEMGINGLYFSRLDYQDRQERERSRTTEMVWQLRPSTPQLELSLFTSILARGNYMMPPNFNFETMSRDAPVMDDPEMDGMNVQSRVKQFEQIMNAQRNQFPSNHLMVTMGMDFAFVNSVPWFMNMDALIRGTNNYSSTYHMLYSTPSCYTRAVHESVKALTNKTDDFFPYADKPQAYWTGYFTSRPALKRLVRDLVNVFGTTRQLLAFSESPIDAKMRKALMYMKDAQGILQHHDAVTGTAKQHVTDDYRKRAAAAIDHGRRLSAEVLKELHCGGKEKHAAGCLLKPSEAIEFCPLLNETNCPFSEANKNFAVVAYNPMAEATSSWLRIPVVFVDGKVHVVDPNGEDVAADIVPILDDVKSIPSRGDSKATHELVFRVALPPLGSAVYFVQHNGQSDKMAAKLASSAKWSDAGKKEAAALSVEPGVVKMDGDTISNGVIKVTLDDKGRLDSFENIRENVKVEFTHFLAFYPAQRMPSAPSGAYLFNPDTGEAHLFAKEPVVTVVSGGDQLVELHYHYSNWAKAIVRLYAGEDQLEVQWIAGPIPTDTNPDAVPDDKQGRRGYGGGGVGREVVSVFESSIRNTNGFYTDANGREMLYRKKDHRPSWSLQGTEPVSQNYYPLNARISTNDTKAQMTVVIDRAQGGTGMRDGQLEVMVHRRLVQDDQLGVGEPLQEVENGRPLVATGRHWVTVNAPKDAPKAYRKFSQKVMFPPLISFSAISSRDDWVKNDIRTMTSVGSALSGKVDLSQSLLPSNVHLMTLERDFQDCSLMMRLEHLYEGGEDEKLAAPTRVELLKFIQRLLGKGVSPSSVSIEELALGANMPLRDLVRLKWETTDKGNVKEPKLAAPSKQDADGEVSKAVRYDKLGERILSTLRDGDDWQTITMLPMQIRTFCVRLQRN